MLCIVSFIFCIWVIYFNGAERLENTILGYFEFGELAEKTIYIKTSAWFGLVLILGLFIKDMVA